MADKKNLAEVIKENFHKLQKVNAKDHRHIQIPAKLFIFVEGKKFYNLIESMIDYFENLINTNNKQKILETEAKKRGSELPKLLTSDIQVLAEKGKNVAFKYSLILLDDINQKVNGKINMLNEREERDFYESLITLITLIMKDYFPKQEHKTVEEEISRLFRTNAFNEAKRRYFLEEKYNKYPTLKDVHGKETVDQIIDRMTKRSVLPKENWEYQYRNEKSEIKPGFIRLKPYEATQSRSPLLSILAPSKKLQIAELNKTRKYNNQVSKLRPITLNTTTEILPEIIEKEINSRNISICDMSLKNIYHTKRDLSA